jgi:hypothetical protein
MELFWAKVLLQTLFLLAFYKYLVSLPFSEAYQDITDCDKQIDTLIRFIPLINLVPCLHITHEKVPQLDRPFQQHYQLCIGQENVVNPRQLFCNGL